MPKILIVEDDTPIREMYTIKLEVEGYEVAGAANGEDGLQIAKEFMPDLILLDLMMPVMGGDKMLAHLRSEDWGKDILVIVLTNISADEAPMDLRLLRVEKYIVKAHHTPKQVLEITEDILRRYKKLPTIAHKL